MRAPRLVPLAILLLAGSSFAPVRCMSRAQTGEPKQSQPGVLAVEKALAVLDRGAREYPEHRQCFGCHHQTFALLAHREARGLRLAEQSELEPSLAAFVGASFEERRADLDRGEGIGGKGLTVGYGLWTLRLAGREPDDLTDAMVGYLLKVQAEDGHWELHSVRPPAEESVAMCTLLAAAGLRHYGRESQRAEIDSALARARTWLDQAARPLHEDRVAKAWAWKLLGGSDAERDAARQALFDTQRADGGWSQTPELASDAYATATALYALLETGLAGDHESVVRGGKFLIESQGPDGSWHVVTRAEPVQVFFDNGDPHGNDQFISMMATGWSAAVLARLEQLKLDSTPAP